MLRARKRAKSSSDSPFSGNLITATSARGLEVDPSQIVIDK
jgi:hypothetical protein